MSHGTTSETSESFAASEAGKSSGLRVTNWPLRDAPLGCLAVYFFSVLMATGAGLSSHSVSMGLLTLLALMLVFWKLWIPITAQFDPHGVVLTIWRWPRRIAWRDIHHLELHKAGVFLCPYPQPAYRSPLHSLFLPWGPNRAPILAFCRVYRPVVLHGENAASSQN